MTENIKPISKVSFEQIKKIAKALKQEVAYSTSHNCDPEDDYDFSCLNDPSINGNTIANDIDGNVDILATTNFNVVYNDDNESLITYADLDPVYDASLDVEAVSSVMNKLVKMGRIGIAKRIRVTGKLSRKIHKMQNELDLEA